MQRHVELIGAAWGLGGEAATEGEEGRPQVARHRRATGEGAADAALGLDSVPAHPTGDEVAVPLPLTLGGEPAGEALLAAAMRDAGRLREFPRTALSADAAASS